MALLPFLIHSGQECGVIARGVDEVSLCRHMNGVSRWLIESYPAVDNACGYDFLSGLMSFNFINSMFLGASLL